MNKKKLLLWDADALCYLGKDTDTLQDILKKVDDKIQEIIDFTDADMYALFISKGKYFRHDLTSSKETKLSTYKAKRGKSNQKYIKVIKEYLISEYGAKYESGVEADDLVVYWNNTDLRYCYHSKEHVCTLEESKQYSGIKIESVETIIVATDKDVLKNTSGKHINPNYLNKDTKQWEITWIETSKEEAWTHFWKQMILGDTTDGISGLKGKGEAYFNKHVVGKSDIHKYSTTVMELYIEHYNSVSEAVFEFQKNFRLLKMLSTDEEFLREVGYLPTLDNIQFVNKVKQEELELNF